MKWFSIVLIASSAFGVSTGTDNEICSAAPDMVFDGLTNYAGFWFSDNECRTLLKFDMDKTDEGGVIQITVFRHEPDRNYSLYEITELWDGSVTWNTQPRTGEEVAAFRTTEDTTYYIPVSYIPEYGWMIEGTPGESPPVEIYSFESDYPPVLDFTNTIIRASSFGAVKAVYR